MTLCLRLHHIGLAVVLTLILALPSLAVAQPDVHPYVKTPWTWHEDPDLSTRPLGPVAGEYSVQYQLGEMKVDEYLSPAQRFPLPLSSDGKAFITSNFGYRYLNGTYDEHFGLDLRAASGTPVYAINGGTVTVADGDPCGAAGRWIEIDHGNGWFSRYMHLSSLASGISVGARVNSGQEIGRSGASGYCSNTYYDAHLHFEIRHRNGGVMIPYDPVAFYTTFTSYHEVYKDENNGNPYIPTQRRSDQGIWTYLVQDSLVWHGYSLAVDGIFGSQTESVVKQFQQAQGITVDGIVGPVTWGRLMGKMGR